jgi:hypothetical protein
MFTVFRQIEGNQSVYLYRKQCNGNSHIIHIGNGMYQDRTHPEIRAYGEVASGFQTVEDVLSAIAMYIEIDKMRGIDAWQASAQTPALRVA